VKDELTNFIPHPSAFILSQRRPVNQALGLLPLVANLEEGEI
jgi:hypothetical protein